MNNTRDFGIEIECISKIAPYELSTKVQHGLNAAGINQTCQTGGYGHDRGNNETRWEIQPDASIRSTDAYPHRAEIVSPRLKGEDGLKALKVVCDVIREYVNVNKSCGLHVHHNINNTEDVRNVINAWIDNEHHFMSITPASRRNNHYCRTWQTAASRRGLSKMHIGREGRSTRSRIDNNVREWWHNTIDTRYATLNMEGYLFRGAVEFRLHSGSYEYDKISNWMLVTQRFVDAALNRKLNSTSRRTYTFEQLCEKLFDNESSRTLNRRRPSQTINNENHIHPEAKKQTLPRDSSKLGLIAKMLLQGGHSKGSIARALRIKFGRETGRTSYEFQVGCKIADFASLKYGFGWNITMALNGNLSVVPLNNNETEGVVPSNSNLIADAFSWFKERHEAFINVN